MQASVLPGGAQEGGRFDLYVYPQIKKPGDVIWASEVVDKGGVWVFFGGESSGRIFQTQEGPQDVYFYVTSKTYTFLKLYLTLILT